MKISSPFLHQSVATSRLMLLVCVMLLPGTIIQAYFFGPGVLINLVLCSLFSISAEALVAKLRNRSITETLKDNSALLTGLLLGLALPPTLPFWMTFVGCWFAIIFAKQLYGGLGFNPFNPAMVGYVLLLISFPVEMTAWLPIKSLVTQPPSLVESFELILFSKTAAGLTVDDFRKLADGFTMATPLDFVKTEHTLGKISEEIFASTNLTANLSGWFWINAGFLFGGVALIGLKIIRWHIPVSLLAGIVITSTLLNWLDSDLYSSSWFHLTSGATMLAAFFIATDPVSASTTPRGRIIYGLVIGMLIVIIRTFGGYPDAVAFSVLLLNMAVPTIDHYTRPIIYGHHQDKADTHE